MVKPVGDCHLSGVHLQCPIPFDNAKNVSKNKIWPSSMPTLKPTMLVHREVPCKPSSEMAAAKPMPCNKPQANTISKYWPIAARCLTKLSPAINTILAAINGSTRLAGTCMKPSKEAVRVMLCASVKHVSTRHQYRQPVAATITVIKNVKWSQPNKICSTPSSV